MTPSGAAVLPRAAGRTWSALLLAAFLVSGCEQGPDDGAAGRSEAKIGSATGTELAARQVLRKGIGAEPESLDPHRAEGVSAANVLRDLYEGLTGEAPDGTLIPGAADSWVISEDGRTYTFHIRSEARWSNGEPLTAGDFEFGLRRSADPKTLSRYSSVLFPIVNAEAVVNGKLPPEALGVRAIDERNLEIRLTEPTPYFLGLLTHSSTYPVHRPSVERYGMRFARPGTLVGNGAYALEQWVVQSHMRLVRNPYYWDNARTVIEQIWLYPVENPDAELKRYRAAELDYTETVPTHQLGWIRQNLGRELVLAPYLGSYFFDFNVTRPPFKDNPKLRQALAMALDREIIAQRVASAGEIPAYGWIPPVSNYQGQKPQWAAWTQAQRNTEARKLYAQAGYSAARPLQIDILYNTGQNHPRLAAAMASMWQDVLGVEATLSNQEWKVFLQTRHQKQATEVVRGGWIGDYNDAYSFAQLMHSKNLENDPGYNNPKYDALLDQAAVEAEPRKRAELLQAAERVFLDDMPIIPLYFYVSKHLVKPWVGGYQPNIMDHHHTKDQYILSH